MSNSVLTLPEYVSSIYPKEKIYFTISTLFSFVLWLIIIIGTMGISLFYILFFAISVTIGHAIFLSYIKGYGIKVSEKQFGNIYTIAKNASEKLGLKQTPDIYIYNMD